MFPSTSQFQHQISTISSDIKTEANRIGFELVGIAPAVTATGFHDFQRWLNRGFAGEMGYLPRREDAYEHPRHVLDGVKSIVMLGANYHSAIPQAAGPNEGAVSRYAWGAADYHEVLKNRLDQLADFLHEQQPGNSAS